MPGPPRRHLVWLAIFSVAAACGGAPTAASESQRQRPARVLVVTYTTGFRHSSIDVAEPIIQQLGKSSGLFDTSVCRSADGVRRMLVVSALSGIDAVVFGPGNIAQAHTKDEWVSLEEVEKASEILYQLAISG